MAELPAQGGDAFLKAQQAMARAGTRPPPRNRALVRHSEAERVPVAGQIDADLRGTGMPGHVRQPLLEDAVDGQRHPVAVDSHTGSCGLNR